MKKFNIEKLSALFLSVIFFVASSCSSQEEIPLPAQEEQKKKEVIEVSTPLSETLTSSELNELNNVKDAQYNFFRAVVTGAASTDNVLCSPLSAQIAFSLATFGADEDVATEIANALRTTDLTTLHSANNKIINRLPKVHENTTVNIANSFWYDTKYNLVSGFLDKLKATYDIEVFALPYEKDVTRVQMNKWCADNTEGMIDEILLPGEDPKMASFINAIYFKSPWTEEFEEEYTQNMPFYGLVKTSEVPMMQNTISTKAYKEKDTDPVALGLSAGKDAFEVTFIMPPANQSIDEFIQSDFESVLDKMEKYRVTAVVPRFSLYPSTMRINNAMKKFGIEKLFSKGLTKVLENQAISTDIMQKAALEIDEKGAKAAAVTHVGSSSPGPGELMMFNRPFVVLVRENSTGIVLFAGKVVDL